jgi:hypothetical protein
VREEVLGRWRALLRSEAAGLPHLPKRIVKKGAQTPAERQAKKKQAEVMRGEGIEGERGEARQGQDSQEESQEEEVDWQRARLQG